jgi:hypothetical protein
LIRATLRIDETSLRQELEGQKLNPEAMVRRAQQYGQRAASIHQQAVAAKLQDYDKLGEARKYILDEFHKVGLDIKYPDRLDAETAANYLQAIKSGQYKSTEFIKSQPSMIKKYEAPKK